ncbi:hypothetical protein NUE11_000176 [Campylobacter coli]|nr:hypothetical protein [Campylobacter coli]EHQ1313575.1 hypothetical protein [Campylobacter coli]EHR9029670.1 hypothetical protein [Campylobacter coli]EHZ4968489.1 hypothetical protein [Campylobacter coli]EID2731501.1 hypothetical protein [Campylobacter coli]
MPFAHASNSIFSTLSLKCSLIAFTSGWILSLGSSFASANIKKDESIDEIKMNFS